MSGSNSKVTGSLSSFLGASSSPPPTPNFTTFNGSGSVNYEDLGDAYFGVDVNIVIQTIALDTERFVLLAGDPASIVVGTYGTPRVPPTFGTSMQVDSSLGSDITYSQGILLSSNTVYVTYFDASTGTRYGRVFTVSGSTLTAHTSTTLTTGDLVSYPAKCISLLDSSHVIEMFQNGADQDSVNIQVMSIDGSFNVTGGAILTLSGDLGVSEFGAWGTIASLSATSAIGIAFNNLTQIPYAFALSISGTTVTQGNDLQIDTFFLSGQGACALGINSTQAIIGWNATDSGNNQYNKVAILTLSGGTLSLGPVTTIRELVSGTQNDTLLFMQDIIYTGNSSGEYLVFGRLAGGETNDTLQALTISGSSLTSSTNVPINANSIGFASNNSFPCMLTPHVCIYPALQYDGSHYGVSVLIDQNTLNDGDVIFFIESDANFSTVSSSSYGNGSGTMGLSTVTVSGVDLSNILIPMAEFIIGSDFYTVQSVTFTGGNTVITTTSSLTKNYSSEPIKTQLITQMTDKSINAYEFTVGGSGISPITGKNGSLSPMICYGNDGTPTYLECDTIKFPINWNAYCSIVVQATDSSPYIICGSIADSIQFLFDFQYSQIQFNNNSVVVGNYTTAGAPTLVQCSRIPYNLSVTVNNVSNDTSSADCFALGVPMHYTLGSIPLLVAPFAGAFYAIKLRWGIPTTAQITADTNYFISKYGV